MIGQARGSKRESFKYHDSAERVLFSDLRNSLLSVSIKNASHSRGFRLRRWVSLRTQRSPGDESLGAVPRASQSPGLMLPADAALHPPEFSVRSACATNDCESKRWKVNSLPLTS